MRAVGSTVPCVRQYSSMRTASLQYGIAKLALFRSASGNDSFDWFSGLGVWVGWERGLGGCRRCSGQRRPSPPWTRGVAAGSATGCRSTSGRAGLSTTGDSDRMAGSIQGPGRLLGGSVRVQALVCIFSVNVLKFHDSSFKLHSSL